MEAELASLAVSGATTLVGLMAGDAWAAVKSRCGALFGRGRPEQAELVEGELEESRRELAAARGDGDESAAADIEAMWRLRLRRLLQEDPAAADALRALIAEAASAQGPAPAVHNTISGGDIRGPVIQSGTITGDVRFG